MEDKISEVKIDDRQTITMEFTDKLFMNTCYGAWKSMNIFHLTFDDLLKIKAAVDKALMEEADRLETSAVS